MFNSILCDPYRMDKSEMILPSINQGVAGPPPLVVRLTCKLISNNGWSGTSGRRGKMANAAPHRKRAHNFFFFTAYF